MIKLHQNIKHIVASLSAYFSWYFKFLLYLSRLLFIIQIINMFSLAFLFFIQPYFSTQQLFTRPYATAAGHVKGKGYIPGILLLISPLIIFLYNFPIYKTLFFVLLWHLFLTIPLLTIMSKIYFWDKMTKLDQPFQMKTHPFFLIMMAFGFIYPFSWGLYLSLSRYFRLGSSMNIISFLIAWLDYVILAIFIFPNMLIWLYVFYFSFKQLKEILWDYTESLVFSFHISALQYFDYFYLCKVIHKSHFIVNDFFTLYPGAFYRQFVEHDTSFHLKLSKLFNHPFLKKSIDFFVLGLIIFRGNIYFGLYLIFIYPSIKGLLYLYDTIGGQNLVHNMCLSDYLYLNFEKPRYYLKFWFLAKNPLLWYKFKHKLPPKLEQIYQTTAELDSFCYASFSKFHINLPYRIHGYTRVALSVVQKTAIKSERQYAVKTGYSRPLGMRIAAFYKCRYGVRWFHSTRPVFYPNPQIQNILHPFTTKFIKDPFAIFALLNRPGQNFGLIQQHAAKIKIWPKTKDLHISNNNLYLDEPNNLIDVLELNFVMRFNSLATNGVIIGTYHKMKNTFGNHNLDAMQMRPDMISYWINNNAFLYKKLLGVDEKHKIMNATNAGRNQVINDFSVEEYKALLVNFSAMLEKKKLMTPELQAVISELQICSEKKDFNQLLQLWAQNLTLFPDKCKPPLMIEKTFDDSHLTPEALVKLRQGEVYIQKVSDQLSNIDNCIRICFFSIHLFKKVLFTFSIINHYKKNSKKNTNTFNLC